MSRLAPEIWLEAVRSHSGGACSALALPDRRSESWKYSRVSPLLEEAFLAPADPEAVCSKPVPYEAGALQILVVDGVVSHLPDLPAGLEQSRTPLSPSDDGRPFVVLNAALAGSPLTLRLAPGVQLEQPIELLLMQNADGRACGAHPRVHLELGAGASAVLIERQIGTGMVFTNSVIQASLAANAQLSHYRTALGAGAGCWLTALDVRLAREARYSLAQAAFGAAFRRSEICISLDEPGAHAEVGSATLTCGREHMDTQLCLEHAAPGCTSRQVLRSLVDEHSRTILNGRIHIHRQAQKTDATLSMKNLLLSHEAEIDAKPELEIYADDVICAHGATVGQLDPAALFLLRTRGIGLVQARVLLSLGFLAESVNTFPHAGILDEVRAKFEAVLSASAEAEPE